jgi:hypothetical protein
MLKRFDSILCQVHFSLHFCALQFRRISDTNHKSHDFFHLFVFHFCVWWSTAVCVLVGWLWRQNFSNYQICSPVNLGLVGGLPLPSWHFTIRTATHILPGKAGDGQLSVGWPPTGRLQILRFTLNSIPNDSPPSHSDSNLLVLALIQMNKIQLIVYLIGRWLPWLGRRGMDSN